MGNDRTLESQHVPTIFLNTTDPNGIRTFVGCSCGVMPRRMPQSGNARPLSYMAHARKVGLQVRNISHAVYGPGYPAAGMTWNEWYAAHPGEDPFGERPATPTA